MDSDHDFGTERAPMPANRRPFGCAQDRRGSRLCSESVIYLDYPFQMTDRPGGTCKLRSIMA